MKNSHSLAQNVERHDLSNGMTVLLLEDHSLPIVTSMIWYRVGSRLEPPGLRGVSHFLEHLLFKETRRYAKGEIDAITTRHGGSNNAFTSMDATAFYFSFSSDRWQTALEIEASRMREAVFDPQEFEAEKRVVLEELKMELDSPWGQLRQRVESNSFEAHPYRYPVIGLADELRELQLQQVVDFYQTYYVPNNSILVVVGDLRAESSLGLIEDLFGGIEAGDLPPTSTEPAEPRLGRRFVRINRRSGLTRLLISYPAPAVTDPHFHALQLLDCILCDGKLSRLYQSLVEDERLVSLISTEMSETLHPYLLLVGAELDCEAEVDLVQSRITDELTRLTDEPVTREELERARNQVWTQALQDFETTLDQAVQLGQMATLNQFHFWPDYWKRLEGITAQELREAARLFLDPEKATVGISGRTS